LWILLLFSILIKLGLVDRFSKTLLFIPFNQIKEKRVKRGTERERGGGRRIEELDLLH
jgi:hypothetical protein